MESRRKRWPRKLPHKTKALPFTPEQKLDADFAMRAYTYNPALAIGIGNQIGKIAVGYGADILLFERDPRLNQVKSVQDDPIRMKMIGGVIYQ